MPRPRAGAPAPKLGIEIGALALANFEAPLPPLLSLGLDFLPPFLNLGLDFLPILPNAGLDFFPFLPKKGKNFLPNGLKGFFALGFLNARGNGKGFFGKGALLAKSCLASLLNR